MYACLSVCQTITFEGNGVGSTYLYIRYISRQVKDKVATAKTSKVPIPAKSGSITERVSK